MKYWKWILTLGAVFYVGAAAQTAKPKKERKLASVEKRRWDDTRISARTLRKEKDTVLHLSLTSGYARNSSNSARGQAQREKNGSNQGLSLGLDAKLDFKKYGYAEVEGYYAGTVSGRNFTNVDQVSGSIENGNQEVKSYGVLAEAGAQIPLGRGSLRWKPRLGVGVGYMSTEDATDIGGQTEVDEHAAFGPYGSVGLGVTIADKLTLSGDAALSAFAKRQGEYDSSLVGASSARFARVRAGASYQISQPVSIGLQYTQRTLLTGKTGEQFDSKETTKQFLGSLQWNF